MAKVADSYQSIIRGVSEQVPQDRRSGQHFEQVNFNNDPVRGCARRHGSLFLDEQLLGPLTANTIEDTRKDMSNFKTTTFTVGDDEYDMSMRVQKKTAGTISKGVHVFNKETGKFVEVITQPDDTFTKAVLDGGISAAVSIGKYVFMAGNNIIAKYKPTEPYENAANKQKLVAWVRGGAYSRTYTITLIGKTDTPNKVITYKTMSSAYEGILDTSDIAWNDQDYQKKVNDRTNAYNTAVTQHIAKAAADIQPGNIARKLIAGDGLGPHSVAIGSTCVYNAENYVEIECDDDGDGSFLRGVGNVVRAADEVSAMHWAGKVVKVRPKRANGGDSYYLVAEPKVTGKTGWTDVVWKETAGHVITPVDVFCYLTVKGGYAYMASTTARMKQLTGDAEVPDFIPSRVGDLMSTPVPYFFGRRIDYLGVFQDRLIIGAGAVFYFSKPGDYLNLFRQSVLDVFDDDPIEMYAQGSEDDTIVASTTYDRNLVMFGKKQQYSINGKQALTPKNAYITVMSSYEDAVDAFPKDSGNYVFYAKAGATATTLHQIQMGMLQDTPESYEVSQQLDTYLQGVPIEIVAMTAPNVVFLRTTGYDNGVYVYRYLDAGSGQERLFDAWSKVEWDKSLGTIVGMSKAQGALLVYTLRTSSTGNGDDVYLVCDEFSMDTSLSSRPYLDSARLAIDLEEGSYQEGNDTSALSVAYGDGPRRFIGTPYEQFSKLEEAYPEGTYDSLWVGTNFRTYVTPTNPYIYDDNDKAIVHGRLTLSRVLATVADTSGMYAYVETQAGKKRVLDFTARILSRRSSAIGHVPVVDTTVTVPVGREVRECKYTLEAKEWLPLTLTALSWSGQFFNNVRH